MPTDPQTILDAAMQLGDDDRMRLVSRLLESLPPEDSALSIEDPDLVEELDHRFDDDEGAISWPDLKAEG